MISSFFCLYIVGGDQIKSFSDDMLISIYDAGSELSKSAFDSVMTLRDIRKSGKYESVAA